MALLLLFLASNLASFKSVLGLFQVRFFNLFLCFQGVASFVSTIFHFL